MTQPFPAANALFIPLTLGDITLPNRVLMAPLTRNRAHGDGTPNVGLAARYYAQRASAGLIISEATQISAMGKGYIDTPGIHTPAHVAAWRHITDAVHAAGGRIFIQLWHVGGISHTSLLPSGAAPVTPSGVHVDSQTFLADGFAPVSAPRALALSEIAGVVADYAAAAENARAAGFDGAEIHAANGYLIDQFLHDGTNRRDDAYGGSAENRARLLAEVTDAVTGVFGAGRTGVRLAPTGTYNGMTDSDPEATFATAIDVLNDRGLAFLHFVEGLPGVETSADDHALLDRLRRRWRGLFIANGGYDGDRAAAAVADGRADAVAFGRAFIANPDLPRRLLEGAALNKWDGDTFYGGDARGYTDYPSLAA